MIDWDKYDPVRGRGLSHSSGLEWPGLTRTVFVAITEDIIYSVRPGQVAGR